MAHYFIVELKADVVEPCYFPDFVKPEGEEKRQFMPVSIVKDWWIYPSDSKEYKIKLFIKKLMEYSKNMMYYLLQHHQQ